MKSGRLFNGSFSNYQNEIEAILREHRILSDNYTINEDGSINVLGNVNFTKKSRSLLALPLNFNKVSGDFNCSWLGLTTLKGSPMEVGGTLTALQSIRGLICAQEADCFVFDDAVFCILMVCIVILTG
jgi:hypothetical protein